MNNAAGKSTKRKKYNVLLLIIFIFAAVLSSAFFYIRQTQNAAQASKVSTENEVTGNHSGYEEPVSDRKVVVITITNKGFEPKELTAEYHEAIIAFKNTDSINHTVIADRSGDGNTTTFNTGIIKPGQQISVVEYEKPGRYTYYDEAYPDKKGTIIAEE